MSEITYTDPARVIAYATDVSVPLLRSASGYGPKLPTRHRLRYETGSGRSRWLRVYVARYGNSGSAYVHVDGVDRYLDTETEYVFSEGVLPDHIRDGLSTVFCSVCFAPCLPDGIGTGYAVERETDSVLCYPCADNRQVAKLRNERVSTFPGYMSCDGKKFTTWTGGELGTVTRHTESRSGFHGSMIHYWTVRDVHGNYWHGRNGGPGMCVSLRRYRR